jgi:hypothetical protein
MRGCTVALLAVAACMPPLTRAADNVIDLQYRSESATATPTQIYRWVGSRSLAVTSRCKMAPTDSENFAIRAEHCGGLAAWYWGVARLFLEQANSSAFAPSLRQGGRLRWVDLPGTRCD